MSDLENEKISVEKNAFDLTEEQRDTADLLERLLGKAVSDRYVDFCRLSAGAFELRVPSPLASHALREMDSILRQTLVAPLEAMPVVSEGEEARATTAINVIRSLGYDEAAVDRVGKALRPNTHKDQIRKICASLGLAEDSDIAKAWLSISRADKKAHERPFNRTLEIDDEFRTEWAAPFHMVVRGVAVELQSRYTALTNRVEELAAMPDKARAVALYEKEIPGALPLQWHFYRTISSPAWLPELIGRGVIREPMPYSAGDEKKPQLRAWPVGRYLLQMAQSDDAATRALVIYALQPVASSLHPDVRRDGLEILAGLPAQDSARAVDLAIGWLTDDEFFFGVHLAEQLLTRLAEAGEKDACLKLARALYRVFKRNGHIGTMFSSSMYEHSIFQKTPLLTETLGLAALNLFCELLYDAALLTDKIRAEPYTDYTSFSSIPLPRTEADQHDVFGALTGAVLRSASQLIKNEKQDGAAVISALLARPYRVYKRIALNALAARPQAAPDAADALLLDVDLLENESWAEEYAALAVVRFPHTDPEKQKQVLALVDAIPGKYIDGWRKRFAEHSKREPTPEDERDFNDAVTRNAIWHWREVLPADRQRALDEIVARMGRPDEWRSALGRFAEESPLDPADFDTNTAEETAAYLKSWAPGEGPTRKTKTALAFELRKAAQQDPGKFSAGAMAFAELPPLYVRRLLEGLHQTAQNKGAIDWLPVFDLIEAAMAQATPPTAGESSDGGDDPSWFWAAKEGVEVLRTGLQQGEGPIPLEHADRIASIMRLVEQIAPDTPEISDFEERYARSAYFGAESTMYGLAAELNLLFVYWQSKHEKSPAFAKQREAFNLVPQFAEFAERALEHRDVKGRIARAVFGRYLSWLIHFGEEWVRANFSKLFPGEADLREAAWAGYLINDNRPARDFVEQMRPMYEAEFARFKDAKPTDDRDHRQERCGDYVIVLYLWGVLPDDLLDKFTASAPDRVRRHVMWFIGRDLKNSDMPAEVRDRALKYWEKRLDAAVTAANKDDYRQELGVISTWDSFATVNTEWLIAQQIRMFNAGFAPSHAYSVVEWSVKVAPEYPDGIVELIEALLKNPRTDHWAYTTQQGAIRSVLSVGLESGNAATRERVRRIISHLATLGETSFLDLIKTPPNAT